MNIHVHRGEVAVFPTKDKWEKFRDTLKDALIKQSPRKGGWKGFVEVGAVVDKDIRSAAARMNSAPYPGYAVAYPNEAAIRACAEIGLELPVSDAPDKELHSFGQCRQSCNPNSIAS